MLETDNSYFQISSKASAALSLVDITEVHAPFTAAAKVCTLLDCAIELASKNYPLLSEEAWCQLLSHSSDFLGGRLSAAMILAPNFLANWIFQDGYLDDGFKVDLDAIAALTAPQLLAVHLILDRYLAWQDEDHFDLREFLAEAAGRAAECVFKDDPTPEELWAVREVRSTGEGCAEVILDYAGEPMAVLGVAIQSDKEFKFHSLDFKSSRRLAFPDYRGGMYGFLMELATKPVFEFIDANKADKPYLM